MERGEGVSPAMAELRLIYANADTRQLSSADIVKQAERVETLLYQLKEEGVAFPGRMRDHVAQACKISKSKLARLKVIQENLIPLWAGLCGEIYGKNKTTDGRKPVCALEHRPNEKPGNGAVWAWLGTVLELQDRQRQIK